MAKLKIFLEPGESRHDVEDLLVKAIEHHRAGKEHRQAFHQPSAREVFNEIIKVHDQEWEKMLKEINKVLDEDV